MHAAALEAELTPSGPALGYLRVRMLQGAAAALGAPLGWLLIQMLAGDGAAHQICTHTALYVYLLAGSLAAFTAFGALLGRHEDRLLEANRMLDALSVSDPVTGLKNPRYFRARLEEVWSAAVRDGTALSLLVLDLDHFKDVNDRHGHPVGDRVLVEVAAAVSRAVRSSDTAARLAEAESTARMGGEEFAVLLPGTCAFDAIGVGERVLRAVREVSVPAGGAEVRVTLSIGLASMEEEGVAGADDLYARADAAMYAAKRAGRDRMAVSGLETAASGAARGEAGG